MKKMAGFLILGALLLSACSQTAGLTTTTSSGSNVVTMADQGRTLNLAVGQTFTLDLGDQYRWKVDVTDPGIANRSLVLSLFRGGQGVYTTYRTGTVTLTITGECPLVEPPCPLPAIYFPSGGGPQCPQPPACEQPVQFTITIVVQ